MTGPRPSIFDDPQDKAPQATPARGATGHPIFGAPPKSIFEEDDPSSPLAQSARLGVQQAPDSAARVLSLAGKTGLPTDVISRHVDYVEQESRRKDFNAEQFRTKNPVVASWLAAHPTNFSVAQDDLDQLGAIEGMWTALSRGAQIGKSTVDLGSLGYQARTARGEEHLDPATRARLNAVRADVEREPVGRGFATDILFQGGKLVGQMGRMMGSSLSSGIAGATAGGAAGLIAGPGAILTAPAAASVGFSVGLGSAMAKAGFEMETGSAYLDLKKIRGVDGQPLDEDVVQHASLAIGLVNALLESTGEAIIAAPFVASAKALARSSARDALVRPTMRSALARFGKTYAATIAGETGTEVMQELNNVVWEEYSKAASHGSFRTVMDDPDERAMFWDRMADVVDQTAKGMLLVGAPGASVHAATDVVKARRAKQREATFLALGEGMQNSKTFQRLPAAQQEIVKRLTEQDGGIETAYLDPEPFTEYFQSQGKDPREVARQLWGDATEYDQAVQTGAAMSVPMARFATKFAPTEDVSFFAREMRLRSPDQMNAREAEVVQQAADERASQTADEAAATQDAPTPTSQKAQIQQQVSDQLAATGRYQPGDVGPLAEQMTAFLMTQGERAGVDPMSILTRSGLTIRAGLPEVATPDPVNVAEVARAAEERRAAKLAAQGKVTEDGVKRHINARTASGVMRSVEFVSTDALAAELLGMQQKPGEPGEARATEAIHAEMSKRGLSPEDVAARVESVRSSQSDQAQSNAPTEQGALPDESAVELFQTLPTRWPTSKKVTPSVDDPMFSDIETLKADPKLLQAAVDAVSGDPGMRVPAGPVEQRLEALLARMTDNLLWLHDLMPEQTRQRAKLWYDGARRIADTWEQKYNITRMQAAGVMAVLSPQKDWFMNVSLAERVLDIITKHLDHRFDSEMRAAAFEIITKDAVQDDAATKKAKAQKAKKKAAALAKKGKKATVVLDEEETPERNTAAYEAIKGMTLREVAARGNRLEMGLWVRAYDEAHHGTSHALISPEGDFGPNVVSAKGADRSRAWGDFGSIGKAVSIVVDGRAEHINAMLGGEHKVRNFYNNIYEPSDPRFVTSDTHNVAAGELRPLSGKASAVADNFGTSGGSNMSGLSGTYAMYLEAVTRAAAERGILPREMQSITWEGVRGLFTDTFKNGMTKQEKERAVGRKKGANDTDQVWARADAGEITVEEARAEILALAGGMDAPEWVGERGDMVTRGETYIPVRDPATGQRILFEVAPDPIAKGAKAKALLAKWQALPAEVRARISDAIAWRTAMDVIALQRRDTVKGRLHQVAGGFGDTVNRAFALVMHKGVSKKKSTEIAAQLGYVLRQNLMGVVGETKFPGSTQHGVVSVDLGGASPESVYLSLRASVLAADGSPLITGHTTIGDTMAILVPVAQREAIRKQIAAALPPTHAVSSSTVFAQWQEEGTDYASARSWRGANKPDPWAPVRGQLDHLRAQASAELERHIDAAGTAAATDAARGDAARALADGARSYDQPAYHGSPHIFDEFKLNKIDTGEGNQAYGWGLYFAGKKDLAHYYRRTLSEAHLGGETVLAALSPEDNKAIPAWAKNALKSTTFREPGAEADKLIAEFRKRLGEAQQEAQGDHQPWLSGPKIESATNAIAALERLKATDDYSLKQAGRTYKVDIPEDDTMLHWDKPLSEQPEVVQQALEKVGFHAPSADEVSAARDAWQEAQSKVGKSSGEWARELIRIEDAGLTPANEKAWFAARDAGTETANNERAASRLKGKYNDLVSAMGATGASAYRALAGRGDGKRQGDEAASRALSEAGVTGIKYLDGTSRGAGAGSYNYVIFDDKLVKIMEYEQRGPAGARGRITIKDGRHTIDLFEGADWSTTLHESGHAYLELLGDLAGESEQQAADYAAILKHLGVSTRAEIGTPQHEQFAEMIESYFMRGQAPSIELRRAFSRFKAWLKALYTLARKEGVHLTPEVIGIFDRMFATDAEIASAEAEARITPLFADAESVGMSPELFSAYRQTIEDAHIMAGDKTRAAVMAEYLREQRDEWKAERELVRASVEADVSGRQIYRTLTAMQRGVDGEPAVKLDRAALVARYDAEFLKKLPRPYIYAKEGGIHPDTAAELFGYGSGDEMLQAIANAPRMKDVIERETDEVMVQRHGDMREDGTLASTAEEALMGDAREAVIRAELRALSKKVREVKPFLDAEKKAQARTQREGRTILSTAPSDQVVRKLAQERIASLRVRDIKPFVYWVAARKSGAAALAAVAKQQWVEAANAKQAELMNLAFYREAVRVKEESESTQQYARRLQKPAAQQRLGKAGAGYLDQVQSILERFDFAPLSNKGIDRRASMASFIKQQEALGLPVNISEEDQNEAFRKPWREMTVEELAGVRALLEHIVHLANLKNRLLKNQAKRTFEQAVESMVSSIEEHATTTRPVELETRSPAAERWRGVSHFFASHRKLANLVRVMDGVQDNGVLWNLLVRPLNAAGDRQTVLTQEMTTKLHDLFRQHYTKAELPGLYVKESRPELHASLTKMGKLMVALNWGTEDNRAKLLNGLSISTGREVEAWQVEATIDTLDMRDMEFVQGVWDLLDGYWPEMKALAERLDGVAAEKIPAAPLTTRHGPYKGGYFPLVYDSRQSNKAGSHVMEKQVSDLRGGAAARASTKAGSRNARVDGVQLPILLDFSVITGHLESIALDLSHTETLIDVNRLLRSDDVGSAIRRHYGDLAYDEMKSTLDDIVKVDAGRKDGADRLFGHLRAGATIAGLGWNLTTAIMQPLGLSNSAMRIGPQWLGRGILRFFRGATHMENTVGWIQSVSPFMANRMNTQIAELNEIRNTIGRGQGAVGQRVDIALEKVTGGRLEVQDIEDSFFYLITRLQLIADVPTWLGQYEKSMASGTDEQTAFAAADQSVIDSQGGGQIKDMASVQRGSALKKLFTTFYTYMNTTWNLLADSYAGTDFHKPADIGKFAADFLMLTVVPVTAGALLKRKLRGDESDDDDLLADLAKENLAFFFGFFVGVRELAGAVQGFRGYEGPAGTRGFAALTALAKEAQQGDVDKAAIKAAISSAGVLFHLPAAQIQRLVDGFAYMSENRSMNPTPILFGAPRQ